MKVQSNYEITTQEASVLLTFVCGKNGQQFKNIENTYWMSWYEPGNRSHLPGYGGSISMKLIAFLDSNSDEIVEYVCCSRQNILIPCVPTSKLF